MATSAAQGRKRNNREGPGGKGGSTGLRPYYPVSPTHLSNTSHAPSVCGQSGGDLCRPPPLGVACTTTWVRLLLSLSWLSGQSFACYV
eukprot:4830953-Amphidinium_carterae.1